VVEKEHVQVSAPGSGGETTPQSPPNPPGWVLIVAAVFGGTALLALIGFALLSGTTHPDFVCNTYPILTLFFALACGLSVFFLGGNALARGILGDAAKNRNITFSAVGGVAVLLIVFMAMQWFPPQNCKSREIYLRFNEIAGDLDYKLHARFWRRDTDLSHPIFPEKNVEILLSPTAKDGQETGRFRLFDGSDQVCWVDIQVAGSLNEGIHTLVKEELYSGDVIALRFLDNRRNDDKVRSNICFKVPSGEVLLGHLMLVPTERKIRYVVQSNDNDTNEPTADRSRRQTRPGRASSLGSQPWASIVSVAVAQETGNRPSFQDLKEKLTSENDNHRIAAREYLEKHFEDYAEPAVRDLVSLEARTNPQYLVGLLHGLIAGIDSATQNRLAPGQSRSLNVELPYIQHHLKQIIWLTAHDDRNVQQQARRLVQRFPVDGFVEFYKDFLKGIKVRCSTIKARRHEELMIYSAIFMHFNRFMQATFESTETARQRLPEIESTTRLIEQAALCLPDELRVDTAALYYARSAIFEYLADLETAQGEARKFVSYLKFFEDRPKSVEYYFPGHIDKMKKLAKRRLALQDQIAQATTPSSAAAGVLHCFVHNSDQGSRERKVQCWFRQTGSMSSQMYTGIVRADVASAAPIGGDIEWIVYSPTEKISPVLSGTYLVSDTIDAPTDSIAGRRDLVSIAKDQVRLAPTSQEAVVQAIELRQDQ
jgi:hypothetical protein